MAIDIKDPMALLEDEMNKAENRGGFAPFFFALKDGEKALIRPLLNMNQYVAVHFHEFFNPATKKYDVSTVCAEDYGQKCQHCIDAVANKKLAGQRRFYLPVYVHAILKLVGKEWVPVTYTNADGAEQPSKGVRLLELKASSSILSDLVAAYHEDDSHDITRFDFVIARKGIQLDTTYTVTLKPQARPLPDDLPKQSQEKIKSDIELARPMLTADGLQAGINTANQKQEAKDAIPEF